jgi:hypothetical protein
VHTISWYSYAFLGWVTNDLTPVRNNCVPTSTNTDYPCYFYYGTDAIWILYGLSPSENRWTAWLCEGAFLITFVPAAAAAYWWIDFSEFEHPEEPNYHGTKLHHIDEADTTTAEPGEHLPDIDYQAESEPVGHTPKGQVTTRVASEKEAVTLKGASLDFVNLCYEVYPVGDDGKTFSKPLLNNISAYCHPGMMVALMGASG